MFKVLILAILATSAPQSAAGEVPVSSVELTGVPALVDGLEADQGPLGALLDDGRGTDYIVDTRDNICGLDDPRQLTRPARVDHAKLIALTPQMQTMKREKINPSSAKGIQLRTAAAKLVSQACEKIRGQKSYCSVWKKIRRRDGKKIADITALVKRQLGS